jgi:uncharacterized protein (DUF433 family)
MPRMNESLDLLERPLYGLTQVDRLLLLKPGTARRWIEGYTRAGINYQPVIRPEPTGNEVVTWGEFVETRLLAEFRDSGVPLIRLRPAIERLRSEMATPYPLAIARPFLSVEGRELVMRTQDEVGLDRPLHLVVVRDGQAMLTPPAHHFVSSVEFGPDGHSPVVERVRPVTNIAQVVIDPLRQFGVPVVRSVPTELIAEQLRAGDRLEMIAEVYELPLMDVEAAIRYELTRVQATAETAA